MKIGFKTCLLTIVVLFMLIIITAPVSAYESVSDVPEYQDVCIALVDEDGSIWGYCNDIQAFECFGYAKDYDWWLDYGAYIIEWDGNILAEECEILRIYDFSTEEWLE